MQLTFIGAFLFVVAVLILLRGSTLALFALLLLCSLMGGSAAIILPALGGASIGPMQFVLPFLVARLLLAGRAELGRLADAIKANAALVAYAGYGLVAAIVGPRIFARALNVPPLRLGSQRDLYFTTPLGPTNQNVTTAVYLLGTLLVALCTHCAVTRGGGARLLVRVAVAIIWIHVLLGVSDAAFGTTGYGQFLALFRNATYAQLEQSYGSFVRIKGIFPEASTYAGFAFPWFVFAFECWLRRVQPRATGPAALAVALVLVFSTSATAYVALGAYAGVIAVRALLLPGTIGMDRIAVLMAACLCGAIAACGAIVLLPGFAGQFGDMIARMTVEKGESTSGLQRLFWARKGIEAFWASHGLGIGPGSFRSSSLFTAILGSTGIIGTAAFATYVLQAFMPLRASTFRAGRDERVDTGAAASWAMLIGLIPASIISASADPGLLFAIFAGAAIGLRQPGARMARTAPPAPLRATPGGRQQIREAT